MYSSTYRVPGLELRAVEKTEQITMMTTSSRFLQFNDTVDKNKRLMIQGTADLVGKLQGLQQFR